MLAEILHKLAGFEVEEQRKYYPRPSLAGPERCIRQMVYWASGVPQDKQIGDRFIHVLNDSSWHEELTADWIRKSAFSLHSQQMPVDIVELSFLQNSGTRYCGGCKKDIQANVLHGHIDGVITDLLGNDYLLEHKAINHFSFEKYWCGDYPLDYITQCCLYIKGLQKINPSINTAILLIKNKNTSAFIDYKILYDSEKDTAFVMEICHSNGDKKSDNPYLYEMQNVVTDTVEKFRLINDYVLREEVPERPYEIGTSFPCGYCQYEKTCFADYESDYKELAQDVQFEGEVVDLCNLYLELSYQEKDIKEHKEEIKQKIKQILKDNNASKGRAGEYVIHNRLQKELRVLRKEDIPANLLPLVTQEIMKEVLVIRKANNKT